MRLGSDWSKVGLQPERWHLRFPACWVMDTGRTLGTLRILRLSEGLGVEVRRNATSIEEKGVGIWGSPGKNPAGVSDLLQTVSIA